MYNPDTELHLVYEALEQLRQIIAFENNGTTSKLLNFLRFCASRSASAVQTIILSPSQQQSIDLSIPMRPQLEPSSAVHREPSDQPVIESTAISNDQIQNTDVLDFQTNVEQLNPSQISLPSALENSLPNVSSLGVSFMTINQDDLEIIPTNSTAESQDTGREKYPWLRVTSQDQCDDAYLKFKNHIHDVIVVPYAPIQQNQEFFTLAEDFAHSSGNPEMVKQVVYRQCFDLIQLGRNSIDFLQTLLYLLGRVVRSEVREGLVVMEELVRRLEEFSVPEFSGMYDAVLKQACPWLTEYRSRVRQQAEIYRIFITGVANMLFYINTPIQQWYNILSDVEVRSSLISDMMAQYLAKNITKQELAQQFFSEENVTKREGLFEGITDIQNLMQQYEEGSVYGE